MISPRALHLGTSTAAGLCLLYAGCRDVPTLPPPRADVARGGGSALLDVAPGGTAVLVGAGDVASCATNNDELTAQILDTLPGAVVYTLGDNAYLDGTTAEYDGCYAPTWGRHLARTRPAVGDADYSVPNAAGYAGYFGAVVGESGKYYYSYDAGDWHVVVLNSKLGTSAMNAMNAWLKADLLASGKACTVAYWHKPYFSSASGVRAALRPTWDVLYANGVELVLNADNRYYERFAPQTPAEVADPAFGIRQLTVGTGGAGRTAAPKTRRVNSEVVNSGTPGVLALTLDPGQYAWRFLPVAGLTFMDAGTGSCHGPPPPVAHAGGPYSAEAGVQAVQFDGSASVDLQGDALVGYAWDFGDGSTGTGARPTHTYAADGIYTATLVVTDANGDASRPAAATVTIANLPPVVSAGPDLASSLGNDVTLAATFRDPGTDDAPWSWRVTWGDGSPDLIGTTSTQETPITGAHRYATLGTYQVVVSVTDRDGGTGADTAIATVVRPAAGVVFTGAGDISSCTNDRDELTAQLLDAQPGFVWTAGDNAYPDATADQLANCYGPTWGRHLGRTYAAFGNHDWLLDPNPSFDYFGDRIGPRGLGYYSVDIGTWHVVVLNDELPIGSTSAQSAWLVSDLAASGARCTLAIWHQPRFKSADDGFIERTTRRNLWNKLYAAGAEIVLNGHQHFYERMHPMRPDSTRDDATGIRQFIVGTGGDSAEEPTLTLHPNSVVRSDDFGVLKLTLYDGSYEWEFLPVPGYTFRDSGSGVCH